MDILCCSSSTYTVTVYILDYREKNLIQYAKLALRELRKLLGGEQTPVFLCICDILFPKTY